MHEHSEEFERYWLQWAMPAGPTPEELKLACAYWFELGRNHELRKLNDQLREKLGAAAGN
jgi:hypothetical protein